MLVASTGFDCDHSSVLRTLVIVAFDHLALGVESVAVQYRGAVFDLAKAQVAKFLAGDVVLGQPDEKGENVTADDKPFLVSSRGLGVMGVEVDRVAHHGEQAK